MVYSPRLRGELWTSCLTVCFLFSRGFLFVLGMEFTFISIGIICCSRRSSSSTVVAATSVL